MGVACRGHERRRAQLTNERLVEVTIPFALIEHKAVYEALCANNSERAATAMRLHIQGSWARTHAVLTAGNGS